MLACCGEASVAASMWATRVLLPLHSVLSQHNTTQQHTQRRTAVRLAHPGCTAEDDRQYDADKTYNLNQLAAICQEVCPPTSQLDCHLD
jgi:hypothetical protein